MEESAYRETFQTPETGPGGGGTRGEAVVFDLADGPLFVLLKLPDAKGALGSYVTRALVGAKQFNNGFEDYFAAVQKLGGWFASAKAELPRENWPIMVRFADINDPKSIEQVDPATAGVKRILLKTTRDEVTTGIEMRLKWLGDYPEPSLSPGHGPYDYSLAATLRHYDFRQGISK